MAGFSAVDREEHRRVIFTNLLSSMRLMLEAMEHFNVPLSDEESDGYIDLILEDYELTRGEPLPRRYLSAFQQMWSDTGVQLIARRGNEYALHDNVHYFFKDIERLFKPSYMPTDQDILHSRLKTTGISETIFQVDKLKYKMFDVGGQRSERKKWIHCFDDCTAILFLVAASGYDQCLVEDSTANQMSEALMLFDTICNSHWFARTSIILFLNKIDLFKVKLGYSPIKKYFPDCKEVPTDHAKCMLFFQNKFIRANRNPNKTIYSHLTNATDTTLLKTVMMSVTDIILQQNLQQLIL